MYIPLEERETIITFNEKEPTASVYTMNGAQEYEVPKKWVKVNAGLILTPEERERRSERGRANRFAQLAKNGG